MFNHWSDLVFQTPVYDSFNFPCGEKHVRIIDLNAYHDSKGKQRVDLMFDFHTNEDIIELLLLASAVHEMDCYINRLYIPYLPFSRQDRVCSPGDSFSLRVMIDLINSIKAREVIVVDPHSEVSRGIYNLKVIEQHTIFAPYFLYKNQPSYVLVSPDKGARSKTRELSILLRQPNLIQCHKIRNPETGKLSGFEIQDWKEEYVGKDLYVIDDICDRGGTFLGIAKELEILSPGSKMILMVTHGFFTAENGIHIFDGIYDEVYTMNGRVL